MCLCVVAMVTHLRSSLASVFLLPWLHINPCCLHVDIHFITMVTCLFLGLLPAEGCAGSVGLEAQTWTLSGHLSDSQVGGLMCECVG